MTQELDEVPQVAQGERASFEARRRALEDFERAYVQRVLAACDGSVTKAAKLAAMNRAYLYRLIERYEELIGRPLHSLDWFEMFSMVRMGCCILRMQMLLRRLGLTDHAFLRAPLLSAWVIETIS